MFSRVIAGAALVLGLGTLSACSDIRIEEHDEWGAIFKKYNVEGGFEYYDNNKERAHLYNKEVCSERFTPAQTFDIFNTLVALETNVANDEQFKIPAENVTYYFKDGQLFSDNSASNATATALPEWQSEMTLKQAFELGNVAYFKQLSSRIGNTEMRRYIDTMTYGNMNLGSDMASFWFNDSLGITPDEQVGFMKRLYHEELPLAPRTQRITRSLMLKEDTKDYKLWYKQGWGRHDNKNVVWVVGFIETVHRLQNPKTKMIEPIPHPYFFALKLSAADGRKDLNEVSLKVLNDLIEVAKIKQTN